MAKDKVLEEKFVQKTLTRSWVEVFDLNGVKLGTITRTDTHSPLREEIGLWRVGTDGAACLDAYLRDCSSLLKLDDGTYITPTAVKCGPIKGTSLDCTWRLYRVRDWNMFPFGLSYWKEEQVTCLPD